MIYIDANGPLRSNLFQLNCKFSSKSALKVIHSKIEFINKIKQAVCVRFRCFGAQICRHAALLYLYTVCTVLSRNSTVHTVHNFSFVQLRTMNCKQFMSFSVIVR